MVRVKVGGTDEEFNLETTFLKPLAKSGEFHRYHLSAPRRVLIFPYQLVSGKASLIDISEIERRAKRTADYLHSRKRDLQGRKGAKAWWAYGYPKNLSEFEAPKIMTRDLAPNAWYCADLQGGIYFPGGAAGGYGIRPTTDIDSRYLLGLLNSRLLDRLVKGRSTVFRNGWFSYEYRFIKDLPIRTVTPGDAAADALRDEIIARVERLLTISPKFDELPPSTERDRLGREIEALNAEVDQRVGTLYGLTPVEVESLK
jgi:hypothetical protein